MSMVASSHLRTLRKAAIDWFMRMRHGDVDHPDRGRFEAWLMACPSHQQAYADVSSLWQDFDSTPHLQSLAVAMAQKEFLEKERQARKRRSVAAAALSILLVVGASLLGYRTWQAEPVMQMIASAAIGQVKSQRLEDGTMLTINASSDIEITYYRDRRLVKLKRGEAIFEVARDEDRPFIIDSGHAQVTVLGTRFAVNRLQHLVRVSVDHGRVRVESMDGKNAAAHSPLLLRDGEVAEIRPAEPPLLVPRSAADAFSFAQGIIAFDKAGLQEIAETLSRYRTQPVKARLTPDGGAHITAIIKPAGIEQFLTQLPRMAPVAIEPAPDQTLIVQQQVSPEK